MTETPTEEITDYEVTQMAIDARLVDLHTAFPAKVDKFDTAGYVDVTPCLNRSVPDGSGGFVSETLPKLANIPVVFPRCGTFFLSFPIQAGDFVLVVCAQRNIGNWRATGNQGDPGDVGMHSLDGAVAIPGVFPDSKALNDISASTMKMGKDGATSAQIEITDTQVKLGGGDQFVALANLVKANFDVLYGILDGVFGATSASIPDAPSGVNGVWTAVKAAVAAQALAGKWPLADVAAQNVKAT